MSIFGVGTLLAGDSGIGKSELALSLIDRGHSLIADDSVLFSNHDNRINGECPAVLQDLLEVRSLGIINIRQLFGAHAIQKSAYLNLIIRLTAHAFAASPRLSAFYGAEQVLEITIPTILLPTQPPRDLKILVECIVRTYLAKQQGYDASHELRQRQRACLQQPNVSKSPL